MLHCAAEFGLTPIARARIASAGFRAAWRTEQIRRLARLNRKTPGERPGDGFTHLDERANPTPGRVVRQTRGPSPHAAYQVDRRRRSHVVMAAARPIALERRDAFLQAVAAALQGCDGRPRHRLSRHCRDAAAVLGRRNIAEVLAPRGSRAGVLASREAAVGSRRRSLHSSGQAPSRSGRR